jgi:carbonic anhydrase
MVNVAVQLERLQRHHSLQQGLRSRELHLTGQFYDIATAQVLQVSSAGISHLDPVPRTTDNKDTTDYTVDGRPDTGVGAA